MISFFKISQHLNWGSVLPLYHVGGLGTIARAYLTQGRVVFQEWSQFSADWISQNQIHILSLVPTQIFDLVQKDFFKTGSTLLAIHTGGLQGKTLS